MLNYHFTQEQAAVLVRLEEGAMHPNDVAKLVPGGRDVLAWLARQGLATMGGDNWQVTPTGRQAAGLLRQQGTRPAGEG